MIRWPDAAIGIGIPGCARDPRFPDPLPRDPGGLHGLLHLDGDPGGRRLRADRQQRGRRDRSVRPGSGHGLVRPARGCLCGPSAEAPGDRRRSDDRRDELRDPRRPVRARPDRALAPRDELVRLRLRLRLSRAGTPGDGRRPGAAGDDRQRHGALERGEHDVARRRAGGGRRPARLGRGGTGGRLRRDELPVCDLVPLAASAPEVPRPCGCGREARGRRPAGRTSLCVACAATEAAAHLLRRA